MQQRIEVDRARIDHDNQLLRDMELAILPTATPHNANTRSLRRTVPGSREILRLVLLDEIHAIPRVPRGQDVVSSGRLVKGAKASAGKRSGPSCTKIGHASLTWAFSEAAGWCLRTYPAGQNYLTRLEKQHGQGKALTVLAHQLARAIYHLFTRQTACDMSLLLQREQGAARVRRTSHGTSMGCAWRWCSALTLARRFERTSAPRPYTLSLPR